MKPRRIEPGPGQESVWDYPRPPRLERVERHIEIVFNGEKIVDTREAWRVLETSHPPNYYIPREAFAPGVLGESPKRSFCEWKGVASYVDLRVGEAVAPAVGWTYPQPTPAFAKIRDHVALYPGPMDACLVDGEQVTPQPGRFYGGWITSDVVGPFKGGPGSDFW